MKLRLLRLRDLLADSFWFLPTVMALVAGAAALASVAIDHKIGGGWVKDLGWLWSGGPTGARGVLTVVAGSLMTVVSIVFSMTISALAQTSSHFGPRVLRNFISDRQVQATLGIFIATFVYCLLVLRTVRSVEEQSFVPYLSVNLGVLLALASLVVLIFFIHHIAQSIQGENLIASVGQDFQDALTVLFPENQQNHEHEQEQGEGEGEGEKAGGGADQGKAHPEHDWQDAPCSLAVSTGYLQRVDDDELMRLASMHNFVLKLEKRPGDFITRGSSLFKILAPASLTPELEKALGSCFGQGSHRTPHQDALYAIQQLVEIGCHALSPGINEPFTALTCIDWLGACLNGVARRALPSPLRKDTNGKVRVIAPALDFEELARASFDQIRIYGASNPEIMLRLLRVIGEVGPATHRIADLEILMHHARLFGTDAAQIQNEVDRQRVEGELVRTLQILSQCKVDGANVC